MKYYAEFDKHGKPTMVYAVHKDKCWYWDNDNWIESLVERPSHHFASGALSDTYNPVSLRDIRGALPTIKAFKYIEPQTQEAGTQPAIQ